ncbi:MAG: lactocin 705-alpha family bacteriocin [Candidatus Competibacteraceae bacterium]|nr:lactocin 705-alpha family bacteriocin [Candidatus Competibacteraceae bacterium]
MTLVEFLKGYLHGIVGSNGPFHKACGGAGWCGCPAHAPRLSEFS